jgi:hypothetical protein
MIHREEGKREEHDNYDSYSILHKHDPASRTSSIATFESSM